MVKHLPATKFGEEKDVLDEGPSRAAASRPAANDVVGVHLESFKNYPLLSREDTLLAGQTRDRAISRFIRLICQSDFVAQSLLARIREFKNRPSSPSLCQGMPTKRLRARDIARLSSYGEKEVGQRLIAIEGKVTPLMAQNHDCFRRRLQCSVSADQKEELRKRQAHLKNKIATLFTGGDLRVDQLKRCMKALSDYARETQELRLKLAGGRSRSDEAFDGNLVEHLAGQGESSTDIEVRSMRRELYQRLQKLGESPRAAGLRVQRCEQLLKEGEAAVSTLVSANLRLAFREAKRGLYLGFRLDELVASANNTIVAAAWRWDPTRDVFLSTYLVRSIRNNFASMARDRTSGESVSLQSTVSHSNSGAQVLADIIPDMRSDVVSEVMSRESREILHTILSTCLKPREKRMLELRFGLAGNEPRSYREIGIEFCLTNVRVQQICSEALEKLKRVARQLK